MLLAPLACLALSMDGLTTRSIDLRNGQQLRLVEPTQNVDASDEAIAAILGVGADVVKAQREGLASFDDAEGQKLWPASVAFARTLVATVPSPVKGCDVVEIGGGLGVVGLTAALAGARSVLITDFQPRSLELVEASAKANGLGDIVSTHLLDWNSPGDLAALGRFDLVLGSDIMYDKELTQLLVSNVVAPLLLSHQRDRSRPEPRALLVDPPLRPSRHLLPEVCAACGLYWGGESPVSEADERDTVMINILPA